MATKAKEQSMHAQQQVQTATQPSQPQAAVQPAAASETVEPKKMDGVTAENFTSFTPAQLIAGYGNKSNAIRGLAALGLKPGPIAKHLGIIYQHARNVLKRPLKRVIKEVRDAQASAAQQAK